MRHRRRYDLTAPLGAQSWVMCGSPTTTVIIRLILLFLDFGGKRFLKLYFRGKTGYTHSLSPSRPPNNTLNTHAIPSSLAFSSLLCSLVYI